jgi:hypothetical protein
MKYSQDNKDEVLKAIKEGTIDTAEISYPNLVDTMLLKMKEIGLISSLGEAFEEKRRNNASIPLTVLLTLFIAGKMKIKTSLSDVPFAISDADLLSELGWNMWEPNGLEKGLMTEGALRNFVSKYTEEDLIKTYNNYVKNFVKPKTELTPNIHILDCTKLEVRLDNPQYEKSGVVKENGESMRGYKLATLRGLLDDAGMIEEIKIDAINVHDLELSKDMIMNSENLKEGDILIQDRGFISRELLNHLKTSRKIDVYMPVKKNMDIYKEAVKIAIKEGKWQDHPNKKRSSQKIQQVSDLGSSWTSDQIENDVPLQACVVWDVKETEEKKEDKYYVFITTNLSNSAKAIIKTYELRPEIEEDFRQLKDFWRLDDFKSTKYLFIVFHIVTVLLGYLFFQIYKNIDEGKKFSKKSLPVILRNFVIKKSKQIIVYARHYFGIFSFVDFLEIYAECKTAIRKLLQPILSSI